MHTTHTHTILIHTIDINKSVCVYAIEGGWCLRRSIAIVDVICGVELYGIHRGIVQ